MKGEDPLPDGLSAPAQRALAGAGITSLQQLATHTLKEIKALHGLGPSTVKVLNRVLADRGLAFKHETTRSATSAPK